MFTLLLAAISSKKKGVCVSYSIVLKGTGTNSFISEKVVEETLLKAVNGTINGKPVETFNLYELELLLEKDAWISKAELYFDKNDILHISVKGKEPVARLFTSEGNSFYIDNRGERMPLSDKRAALVPVFTGFPEKRILSSRDSALLDQVRTTALYILQNPFWMSQVAQIDITPSRQLEMVPVVGNHLVKLGDGENIPAKFRRLMIFYQQVLSKTGFDKYKLIDVQYKGQVVAAKYAGDPKVDSVQLKKNVDKLLRQSLEASRDTVVKTLSPVIDLEPDSSPEKKIDLPVEKTNNPEKLINPHPGLDNSTPSAPKSADGQAVKKPVKAENKKKDTTTEKGKEEKQRKPKAVMPKRIEEDENGGYN